MRIALLQPSYWPEVRRGSERLVHDLGSLLAARGHDVTLITSHPRPTAVAEEDGVRVIRYRRPPSVPPMRWYEHHLESAPRVAWELLRGDYDIAHAFFTSYALAAVKAHALGGPPVVFSFHGIPERAYLVGARYRLEMFQATVAGAAASTVLSSTAAAVFRRYLLTEPVVLPGGVFCDDFEVDVPRAPAPTLVCAASLGDPRKRAGLLFNAFERLRERRPDVRLRLVRTPDPVMSGREPDPPAGAEWIEANRTEELAREYAGAWASVMPAVGEAFGLVMIESLAAGTPVVATRAGACGEIVNGDAIGRLFDVDDESGLSEAMDDALALGEQPETAAACRERAAEYDWARVIEEHERLYDEILLSTGSPQTGRAG